MMNRREFAGLAAGAAATASIPAKAGAQAGFGAPHPPIVPEDDPAITVDRPQLRRPDGVVNAYAAYPTAIRANTPGIVLAMAIWGVDDQLRDTVRRFAKAGYMCVAPDLYSRMRAPSGDGSTDIETFKPFAAQLQRKQYDGDLRAGGLNMLSKAPNCKLGVAGFCMGGHIALIQALDNSDVFDAVAPFYGAIKDIDPTELHIPVCGSYGEKDTSIPAEDVRTWRSALRVPNDVRVYPSAGHAFFDDTRSSYVASAADDAWKRVLAFFKDQLGLQT
ncbi:MAG TPA: dienelactone hydrolase family protein [Candidatus Acidoferrum sp.]|jgi:carboxymethylenebutenolidase|nr:dienelactone hydrolase family protein [Candidatus Acidoferrum sp.]